MLGKELWINFPAGGPRVSGGVRAENLSMLQASTTPLPRLSGTSLLLSIADNSSMQQKC